MRRPTFIKISNSSKQFNNLFFFDTEAYVKEYDDFQEHIFRMAWCCYVRYDRGKRREKWQFCKTPDEVGDFLMSCVKRKRTLYVMAHNIWYDMRVAKLLPRLAKEGFRTEMFICNSQMFILKVRNGDRRITFLNFYQFFPMKLKTIGQAIGLEKLEEAWNSEDDNACSMYCKRDVEILVKAWDLFRNFIQTYDLGKQCYTLASQAFEAFRHRFYKGNIFISANKEVDDLELRSYFGGRTEIFYKGEVKEKPIYYLDVNSLYPYVMYKYRFPVKLLSLLKDVTPCKALDLINRGYCVIADVEVNASDNYIPCKYDGKLIFPLGKFKTTLCTQTLKIALEKGDVKRILRMAVYKSGYIFRDYVRFFYNLKLKYEKEGNKAMRLFTKLFLNSLYGKFGQRVDNIISVEDEDINVIDRQLVIDILTEDIYLEYALLGKRFYAKRRAGLGVLSFPAIASHCTDYGRNVINWYRQKAGYKNVYYMDTDSLFCNERGYQNLKNYIGDELGQLKVEMIINKLIINGPKDYIADDYVKLKGIKKDAKEIFPGLYLQVFFPKFWSDISKGLSENYRTYNIIKKLKREYSKGIVLPDGQVIPIVFS